MPPPDEDAFRRRREAALGHACPFERALLARCAGCSQACSVLLAEREAFGCASSTASQRCHAYHRELRTAARFALRIEAAGPWPFSKEIRLQCGGLLGLQQALDEHDGIAAGAQPAPVADADALLARALQRYGTLRELPYSQIMRAVIHHEPRRRAPR